MRLKREYERFKAFIFDCDGTLWLGSKPTPFSIEALAALRALGKKIFFVTNNSSLSRKGYLSKIRRLGFDASLEEVYSSSYATSRLLAGKVKEAFVIGEAGLKEELERVGVRIVHGESECVIVGIDRKLTYSKLATALNSLMKGAKFIATNADPTLPSEQGFLPGAGAIVAALERSAGRKPDLIVGKPSRYMFDMVLNDWGLERGEVLVIGDRLDTDILGAKKAGLPSALVLTGACKKEDLYRSGIKPEYVLNSLKDLFE